MGALTTLITFEEFERLPDKPGKRELLRGELIEWPPAKQPRSRISRCLFRALDQAIEKFRLKRTGLSWGEVYFETGYQLSPSTWLQPDVSLTHPQQPVQGYLQGAPLLAIEVVSESNTAASIGKKIKEYLTHGAREVWVVYPETNSVWVFREGHGTEFEATLQTGLLPGFSLDLRLLFGSV